MSFSFSPKIIHICALFRQTIKMSSILPNPWSLERDSGSVINPKIPIYRHKIHIKNWRSKQNGWGRLYLPPGIWMWDLVLQILGCHHIFWYYCSNKAVNMTNCRWADNLARFFLHRLQYFMTCILKTSWILYVKLCKF